MVEELNMEGCEWLTARECFNVEHKRLHARLVRRGKGLRTQNKDEDQLKRTGQLW